MVYADDGVIGYANEAAVYLEGVYEGGSFKRRTRKALHAIMMERFTSCLESLGSNVGVSVEKSGEVKVEGRWTRDLKFLGMRYVFGTDHLEAATRKGAAIILDMTIMKILNYPQ